jgi:hypothetical protein
MRRRGWPPTEFTWASSVLTSRQHFTKHGSWLVQGAQQLSCGSPRGRSSASTGTHLSQPTACRPKIWLDFVTARGWCELADHSSPKLSIQMFNINIDNCVARPEAASPSRKTTRWLTLLSGRIRGCLACHENCHGFHDTLEHVYNSTRRFPHKHKVLQGQPG